MSVSCEGALILEQYNLVILLKGVAEREIRELQNQIYARKDLIEKFEKKATILLNAHVAIRMCSGWTAW